MSVGDVYQLSYFQRVAGQLMVNVFHYLQTVPQTGGIAAEDLADAFEASVAALYEPIVTNSWIGTGTQTLNISDLSDFDERSYAPAFQGDLLTDTIAMAICWSFRYNRAEPGQRSGAKRISGLSEDSVDQQTPDPAIIPALDALATAFSATLISGGASFEPVVVRRPITLGVPVLGFYATPSVDFRGVGTQVSRKVPFAGI